MSMRALNRLLGQSTFDSEIRQRIHSGDIEGLLAEYDFPVEVRASVSKAPTSTFENFAKCIYEIVDAYEEERDPPPFPWPTEQLLENVSEKEQRKAA